MDAQFPHVAAYERKRLNLPSAAEVAAQAEADRAEQERQDAKSKKQKKKAQRGPTLRTAAVTMREAAKPPVPPTSDDAAKPVTAAATTPATAPATDAGAMTKALAEVEHVPSPPFVTSFEPSPFLAHIVETVHSQVQQWPWLYDDSAETPKSSDAAPDTANKAAVPAPKAVKVSAAASQIGSHQSHSILRLHSHSHRGENT